MQERKNIVTIKNKPVTLLGPEIKVSSKAPEFTVIDNNLDEFHSSILHGKIRVYNVVHSLETSVCDLQTKNFNQHASDFGDRVEVLTLSVDLPFTQARWCGNAGIDRVKVLSDHKDLSFGLAYGVVIKELRLLARAVFVVDENDTVRYVEYVPELSTHPNYDKVLETIGQLI